MRQQSRGIKKEGQEKVITWSVAEKVPGAVISNPKF